MKKTAIFLFFFFIIGIFYRLAFITLSPQPFIFDQGEYHDAAVGIIRDIFYVDSHRSYGYPLMIALSYKLLGSSFFSWKLMQAMADAASAVLVYFLGKRIFKNEKIAVLSFFLCLFNPITTAMVGVALSEVTQGFFLTFYFLLLLLFLTKQKIIYALLLALVSGFLPQVRPTFVGFTAVVLLFVIYKVLVCYKKILAKIFMIFLVLCIYSLPFLYATISNWRGYRQFSPLTVDNLFVREFYISLYIGRNVNGKPPVIPAQVTQIYQEYSLPTTPVARREMADKYLNLSLERIKENPKKFITDRLLKLWWVWEKHAILIYSPLQSEFWHQVIYWGNVILLGVAGAGFVFWWKSRDYNAWFGRVYVFLLIYISITYAFAMTDGRFSIPVYPLIFLFGGYGIGKLGGKLSHLRNLGQLD
jgi:4-amino-4-deoxy-L-arabinose transferase-like glycosyltransferase